MGDRAFREHRVDIAAKPERQGGRRDAAHFRHHHRRPHRRDLGDIEGLAASIAEVGLLHPVVITPGNVLIAGERRLAACAFLRWREVPVTVVDLDKVVKGEFAENSERKDLTLSEAVAIKRAIEPIERAEAKERQAAAGPASGRGKKNGTGSGKLPTPVRGRAARGQS